MSHHKFEFQPPLPDDKGRAHLLVNNTFSVTLNCTSEGLIVDVYDGKGKRCLDTVAIQADEFSALEANSWGPGEFCFDKPTANSLNWAHVRIAGVASVSVSVGSEGLNIDVHDHNTNECLACLGVDAPTKLSKPRTKKPVGTGLGQ